MRKMTLAQLAEMVKVSAVTIHNIERDVYEPKISTLTNLSRALDVPLGYFTGAGSEGLFIREREAQYNRKISSSGEFHNLPVMQRLELGRGVVTIVKPAAGQLVMLHLVFGRLEAVSGERTLQLVPGDNLYAELFADLELRALETSLCVMVNNRAGAGSIPGCDARKKPG